MVVLLAPVLLALSCTSSFAQAAPRQKAGCKVKENVLHPQGWVKGQAAPPDHIINLRIALPQPDFATLEKHLYEVSDPFHERYGQHLSKEEVEAIVAPPSESVDAVDAWLLSHGLDKESLSRSPANDWVSVNVPVSLAEKMLDTTYHVWTHEKSGNSLVRTLAYSIPEDVYDHVELIQPTTFFTKTKKMDTTFHFTNAEEAATAPPAGSTIKLPNGVTVDASCNTTITVSCLKQLYNAVGFTPSAKNGNKIGITGYLGENANIADLQQFYADQVPAALNTSFDFLSVAGGINSQNISQAGGEANLDTQFAFGISFPTPATFWSTAGSPPFIPDDDTPTNTNEPYLDWLDFVLSHPSIPQTISTSYDDDEQTVPLSFAIRVCNTFAQLGARGVSLMFSSGDGGVGDGDPNPATQTCFSNDGRNVTRFLPEFPSSCPFVTSVGATIHIPEVAVDFSGGGFSDVFPRPAYQDFAVAEFLDTKLPKGRYAGLFNPNGRGIPDVSAQGDNFRVFLRGRPVSIGGTSASSPSFAGFVSLLNSARLSSGLPPLGFLNPALYTIGLSGFTDITKGNAPGCGTPGFNATVGWDPITGLGTPNFGKLRELLTFF